MIDNLRVRVQDGLEDNSEIKEVLVFTKHYFSEKVCPELRRYCQIFHSMKNQCSIVLKL
jgi:hypothetical protein